MCNSAQKNFPKVLIVSHNILSQTSNMGRTLAGFLKGIPTKNLAQLYFHTEVPTTDVCTNYYRVTDFDIIKRRKKDIGTIFGTADIRKDLINERVDEGKEAQIYSYGRKRKPYMYVGRNLLWSTKRWRNKKLINWVKEFKPDVIFFASGDYVFPYKIAMEIADICNIPIVSYVCDDYYFLKRKSISPLYYINRMWYKNTLKKLFSKHKNIVAICDKITCDYQKEFEVSSSTIMTSSEVEPFSKKDTDNIVVSYLGNLGYKRYIPLIEIGKTLKKITDGKLLLDIYSTENRPEILSNLNEENGINFCGSVSYDRVKEIMENSDILIHAESMDEDTKEKVKYSVSTKIADTLSSGRCMLAYGPCDVASIEYLKDNDCACVISDINNLELILSEIVNSREKRQYYVDNALKVAKVNHNFKNNCEKFIKKLNETVRVHSESNAN